MSHRLSQNARHTKDLLEELERDKELDVLREYLTRFELFPRQRDPAAAPIRFEELKELAKHWKLHRQRNFWKTNTTKEDLVRTLYRHINTKIIPQEARDENNGHGSPTHMMNSSGGAVSSPVPPPARHTSVAVTESPRNRSITAGNRPTPSPSQGPRVDNVFSGYSGDLFGQRGNYEDGMIYLSRFRKPTTLLNDMDGTIGSLSSVAGGSDSTLSRHSKSKDEEDDDDDEQEPSADALDFSAGLSREIRLKQECAFSIYHFSTISGHERQMVAEGCMLALSKLAVFEDMEVKRFCAASILNLLCESILGSKMADEGVLIALLELAKAQHEEVRRHTSMALCRFSYERGGQLRLVQEGCVSAILSMLNVPDLETKEACVKTLINIASSSSATVAESVVHVLMKLATRKDQSSAKFAAEAICNLSLLGGSRAKVVEEGILDTVCELAQQTSVAAAGGAGEEAEDGGDVGTVRRHLATALCNLSGLSANLEPLSHGRILECLEELLKCEKPREVREMCAVTIANISSYPPSLKNLALSDAVANLVEIGTHHSNTSIRENTALCLSNMSATADSRALLARFGVVSLLLRFVEEDEGSDAGASALAQQFAVLTLCSVLAHPTACVEILQSNMPAAIARLATRTAHDRVRDLCANALFNVSSEKSLHAVLLQDDTIRAIVRLCRRKGDVDDEAAPGATATTPSTPAASGPPTVLLRYQECALGCLLNLSFAAESRPALLRADVVATLAKVFNKPPVKADELLRQCAGVLANLSFDAEARARMVADNGVRLLRRIMSAATSSAAAAAASDVPVSASAVAIIRETLRCCATACCNLAADALERTPVLDMLIDLSASSYAPTTLTCAIAFAKLASSATHRGLLTRCAELYPALTLMMRCGVEDIQIYSAVALCNLAVEPPAAKPVGVRYVWKEGTVPDFIVNALLRINSDSTKEICARALFNLLTHDELRAAHIKDGVLYALVKLARLESVEIRTLCVTALYNLSCDPTLAETLMELKVAQVITKLCEMEFSSQEIHRKLAACLTNLASEPKPPSSKKVVAAADATVSGGSSSMAVRLVESGALVALLVLCEHADPPTRHTCAAALCFLSAYRVNCEAMATLGLVDVLTKKLLLAPLDAETSESATGVELEQRQQHEYTLNALCNISCFPALHDRVEEAGAVPQIIRVLAAQTASREGSDYQVDEALMLACVQTLGNLAFHARHRRALLTHGLVPTLLRRPQSLRCSLQVGDVCAETVAALCEDALHWHELIETGAVRVLREITEVTASSEGPLPVSQTALRAAVYALSQLARCEKTGETVIADGALEVVARALDLGNNAPPPGEDAASKKAHEARQEMAERCAVILRALSTQGESVCLLLMRDVRLVPLLSAIVNACCPGRRQVQASKHVILAFYNLTSCRVSAEDDDGRGGDDAEEKMASPRENEGMRGLDAMVTSGVVPLLIRLSTDGGSDMAPACAVALAHIKHRIKERLAVLQAQESEGSDEPNRREFEEMDNLMEAGVVTALLAMFELDPAGIQRVDRLAAAMPPALPALRAATEKDWTFLPGNATLRFETPLPVCWDFRSSAIDDTRFVPAEPRTFVAVLAPVVPPSGSPIQDKLYGRFQLLRVRPNKCLLRLENSRFAKLATALLGPAGSQRSSASDLSDAIAMAIGDESGDVDDDDQERRNSAQLRQGNSARKSTIGSGASRSVAGSASTDDDDAGSEIRVPSPVKKKLIGRALMARAASNRGSAVFGIGASSGSNTDSSTSISRRITKAPSSHTVARRPSRLLTDNNHSTSSMLNSARNLGSSARRDSSQHRLSSDSSSSGSGVTLPRI
ncbi:Mitogen-activated protein kinase kinase 5 [Phytophthora pseudosyringae]|uniref:Mitogen-activated protein kinase kinase 5 n=1 Tax=Phytophthora pseudosyringae TaxID=221518 RepID=A0A8T1W0U9_9STRA|nr:Mitogen-activated protein kinase kinase 5 [Phytophthora pseudosyringae]